MVTARKVLVVSSWYPAPSKPFHGIFIARQVRALATRYDVAVIAPEVRTIRSLLSQGWRVPRGRVEEEGVAVLRPRVLSRRERDLARLLRQYDAKVLRAFDSLAATWGTPDLVHAHVVLPAGHAAVVLAKSLGVPAILTEHSGPFAMHLRTAALRTVVEDTLRRMTCIVAVSPALAAEIQTVEPVPVQVVGNVIDTSFFSPQRVDRADGPQHHFAFVGFLTSVKGVDVLLEACGELLMSGLSDWQLRIVGDGPDRADLQRLAVERGVSDRTTFMGTLPPEGVRNVLRWADDLVMPSRHETFGAAAAEALSVGAGVIATQVGGLPYVVGSLGQLVPPEDVGALARAMADAIRGRRTVDVGSARESMIQRFGEEAFLTRITEVYDQVMARPSLVPHIAATDDPSPRSRVEHRDETP